MKKGILYDKNAAKELDAFHRDIRISFQALIEVLSNEGRLSFPDARKLEKDIFEIRLQHHGAYRGCYAYVGKEYIIILHFFQKKTQATPLKHIYITQQ